MKRKNNTGMILGVIAAVIVVVILGYIWYSQTYSTNISPKQNPIPQLNAPTNPQITPPAPAAPSNSMEPAPETYNINIDNFAFSPKSLKIRPGDTVIWTNSDSASHTVTSDSGSELESPNLSNHATYEHTFSKVGTYDYHCTIHPSMKGAIIVE
ncbi:Halocyanin [uncultured archaeon]|nr:Halocyanin [uncultured archaeon]